MTKKFKEIMEMREVNFHLILPLTDKTIVLCIDAPMNLFIQEFSKCIYSHVHALRIMPTSSKGGLILPSVNISLQTIYTCTKIVKPKAPYPVN